MGKNAKECYENIFQRLNHFLEKEYVNPKRSMQSLESFTDCAGENLKGMIQLLQETGELSRLDYLKQRDRIRYNFSSIERYFSPDGCIDDESYKAGIERREAAIREAQERRPENALDECMERTARQKLERVQDRERGR